VARRHKEAQISLVLYWYPPVSNAAITNQRNNNAVGQACRPAEHTQPNHAASGNGYQRQYQNYGQIGGAQPQQQTQRDYSQNGGAPANPANSQGNAGQQGTQPPNRNQNGNPSHQQQGKTQIHGNNNPNYQRQDWSQREQPQGNISFHSGAHINNIPPQQQPVNGPVNQAQF
jgi:hypothetical protein